MGARTLRLEGVGKVFHPGSPARCEALSGITLDLPLGTLTLLTGPSGSGKTTLLSLAGCMARPTSGRVLLEGREISSLPERFLGEVRRRRFGFVFQHAHLLGRLTAMENIILPALPTGATRRELASRGSSLLARFGVEEVGGRLADRLSGGERQRVAVARALINDPDVLLADEPTAHLDGPSGEGLMELFAGLRDAGRTVVVASHDPRVASSPAVDLVVRLRDGRLEG